IPGHRMRAASAQSSAGPPARTPHSRFGRRSLSMPAQHIPAAAVVAPSLRVEDPPRLQAGDELRHPEPTAPAAPDPPPPQLAVLDRRPLHKLDHRSAPQLEKTCP